MSYFYKKSAGLALCTLFSASSLFAQQSITGKVTDANGPVSGVTVSVKGTARGTQTDANGSFTIQVAQGETLRFSNVGFKTKEITVGSTKTINITLEEDAGALEEVIVTAMGITKKQRALGYAASSVKPEEIQRTNSVNVVNALQGKVAGVNINAVGTSGVTSSSSITIRGAKSLDKNNSPIFVVDGIVMENNITDTYGGKDWGSQLKNLNPDDYESIDILKGAAATALYGSRGANGAVVITSKGGMARKGLGIDFSQNYQIQKIYAPHVKLQNVFGAGSVGNGYEGNFLPSGNPNTSTSNFGPAMEGQLVDQYYTDGEKVPFSPHKDNWKALYQDGHYSNTNFAINGGNERAVFRISYSHTDNKGVLKNNSFKRDALSLKSSGKINDIFSVDFGINYAKSAAENAYDQGFYREGQNLGLLTTYYMPRSLDLASFYKQYRDPVTNAVKSQSVYGTLANFLHRLDYYNEVRDEESIIGNVALRAQITENIRASAQANYTTYNTLTTNKQYGAGPYLGNGGYYAVNGSRRNNYNFLFMLDGSKDFLNGDLTTNLKVASEMYGNGANENWGKNTNGGLVVPGLFAFSNSVNTIYPTYNYTKGNYKVLGVFAVLNLAYKNQLFLEMSARNDWNSSLLYPTWITAGTNNYSVFYPSANASWVFTDTFRDKLPEAFSFGKLRASWSRVGMGSAAYATSVGAGGFNQSTIYDQDKNSIISANPNISSIPNTDLKPEIQQSIELGTDIRFLKDRFGIDFTYYKTNTFNQILTLGNVIESGSSTRRINAGNIQNQGVELMLDVDAIKNENLRWNVQFNYTVNRGKIKKLHPDIKEWQLMSSADAGPEIWAYEGGDFGVITSGYNNTYASAPALYNNESNPNDPNNGKRILEYGGKTGSPNPAYVYYWSTEADMGKPERKVLGKIEPDFIGGLNTSLYYKNFDLYAQADGRIGGQFYSHTYKYAMGRGALEESLYGRDQAHGGIARTDYKGNTVYDGIMLDGVFKEGTQAPSKLDPNQTVAVGGMTYKEAVESGLINPMMASSFYTYNYGWGANVQDPIMDNSWIMMREITIGYKLPASLTKKFKLEYARLGITGRNLFYIYNGLKAGLNPESIQSNNPLTPYEYGGVPYSRSFSVSLNVKF
ncbi:SusC/RagA family TonB-linked outer membrane protein [Sphingobacterium anhuiense]|uniref:SusC/RagA family TonB-linked outer membrane protein n=1 Tax=Sphingobacterium anhuiense TaxID=493780 RepID=UPI003C2F59FD